MVSLLPLQLRIFSQKSSSSHEDDFLYSHPHPTKKENLCCLMQGRSAFETELFLTNFLKSPIILGTLHRSPTSTMNSTFSARIHHTVLGSNCLHILYIHIVSIIPLPHGYTVTITRQVFGFLYELLIPNTCPLVFQYFRVGFFVCLGRKRLLMS